jgi:hypothetical protein
MGKSEAKRPQGGQRRSWVDNIKMDLREIIWGGIHWIDLAQDRDQWSDLVNKARFHKMRRSSRVAAQLAASQEGLISRE